MKLAFACPYYGNTPPLVGDSQRANIMNAAEAGHEWIDDYSTSGMQHRNACDQIAVKAAHDPRIDAVFWTEHDVVLSPQAITMLCESLEAHPEADVMTGVVFRRSEPFNPMVAMLDNSLTIEQYEEMKVSKDYTTRQAAAMMTFEEVKAKRLMSITMVDTQAAPFPADTASMCCLLFRRDVFVKTWEMPDLFAVDQTGFFSIDNAFFMRLRDKGFKLYCDPRVLCGHLGNTEIIDWNTWAKHSQKLMDGYDIKKQERLREGGEKGRIYGELTRLANKNRTDKGTLDHTPDSGWSGWVHNYCDFYQAHLEPIRLSAKKVLEVGVWRGGSLKMWRDYFPNATVYGFDNDLSQISGELGDRIVTMQGDQSKREDLDSVGEAWSFDLIVDDGGHTMEQQQITLAALFPKVRPGGYYILEDIHTSFLPDFGIEPGGGNATISVVEQLAEWRPVESKYMTDDERHYLEANVESVYIYGKKSMTCIIRKKP